VFMAGAFMQADGPGATIERRAVVERSSATGC
jgi:hypothetical protein